MSVTAAAQFPVRILKDYLQDKGGKMVDDFSKDYLLAIFFVSL
jgi:hypothetical protein